MTFVLLLACFFLSGFSALLYETAWTREFAFVFGTSELAVVAVLAAYMAGLALGAAVAARWAPRVRRPVLVYGLLELGIALWAISVPSAVTALRGLYLGWLGGLDALPESLGLATHAFHLLGAFVVLVPCTALMGATLPLLAGYAVSRDEQIGPRVGLLYAVNTAGAIAGTTSAAFLLLPALGLRHTVLVGAMVNAVVFAAAALLARRVSREAPPSAPRVPGVPWILPAIAISGAVSFGYEVLWVRLLGQLLGTSTAAFSTMLASFLAGIALGSALASRWARTREAAAKGFAVAELATALAAWLGFAAADRLPDLAAWLGASADALGAGALLGIGLLLPLTLCIGATFPFAVRMLAREAGDASASSARVYAWNTVGSIFGSVGAGYFLLPVLGLEGTLLVGVALNLLLACAAAGWLLPSRRVPIAATGIAALVLAGFTTSRPDNLLRYSPMGGFYDGPFSFFAVGRSATVALIDLGGRWRLTTNGLPESFIHQPGYPSTNYTARWLSMLPGLLRPEARDMLIIGLGGGITLSSVPSMFDSVDVIELEPEVVAANRSVTDREGGDPLADPRVHLRLGDARGALILSDRRYGAIVSQPSHPWTSGASHLYTREFFQLVRSRLAPDGVFVQWIGDAYVDVERLRSLLAALNEAFAYVELYRPPDGSNVMIASQQPFDALTAIPRALAAAPDSFGIAGLHAPEDVLASLALDAEGTRDFAGDAQPNTDDFNILATTRTHGATLAHQWPVAEIDRRDPLLARLAGLRPASLIRRLVEMNDRGRARRLAASLPSPQREIAFGWLSYDVGRPLQARNHFRAALREDPDAEDAAIGLALADREADPSALSPRARAVVEASRAIPWHWETVRDLDDALAQWRPGDLLFREAAELRVLWRLQLEETRGLADAAEQLDQLIARARLPRLLLVHARAMARIDRPERAWLYLDGLAGVLGRRPAPALTNGARELAAQLPEPSDPRLRDHLLQAVVFNEQRGATARASGVD